MVSALSPGQRRSGVHYSGGSWLVTMPTVALYGHSVVLSSIGARIEHRMGLQLMTVDAALPGAAQRLSTLQPDVVVVDLGEAQADSAIALWKAQPHLLLIGVDLAEDRMLVLSGQPARELTADEPVQVIEGHTLLAGRAP